MSLGSLLSGSVARFRGLPTGARVVLGVAAVAVLAVASVFMYRTYDYVQHDNQFCLECHLMRDPFERFAQSAHRGLGCKACHRPNIIERSEMGLAQVVEQPDSIRVHAHVPNEICAECHIEGDPEEWRRVSATAGHRIHLESEDPALEGLNCVECHSSGVHQFTPTDQTCGQGGCHESTEIRLGEMADLTIHCATCHDFATPLEEDAPTETVASSLRPEAEQCLSCHQMRSMLADLPPDEPHGAECGACHNPHEQATPREAVESCATGGCHAAPDTLTPYHQGLDAGVLENCLNCHEAHEFRIHGGGEECLSCHQDIYDDAPTQRVSATPPARRPVRLASAGASPELVRLALAAHTGSAPDDPPAGPALRSSQDTVRFWHGQHRGVECISCHSSEQSHGALTVTSIRDCRSCHHAEPATARCNSCHSTAEVRGLSASVQRTLDIRLGSLNRPRRTLPFAHQVHDDLQCQECHTGGLALSAANVSCSGCHDDHHQPNRECMACHAEPAGSAHDVEVHVGCAGSGCHQAIPAPVRDVPRTRDFCLVCHQDLTDHRPRENCESCHTLPRPRSAMADPAGPHPAEPS
jgi:nitrate/TMAO reductase-like tetraheme cytochrome c subunit